MTDIKDDETSQSTAKKTVEVDEKIQKLVFDQITTILKKSITFPAPQPTTFTIRNLANQLLLKEWGVKTNNSDDFNQYRDFIHAVREQCQLVIEQVTDAGTIELTHNDQQYIFEIYMVDPVRGYSTVGFSRSD